MRINEEPAERMARESEERAGKWGGLMAEMWSGDQKRASSARTVAAMEIFSEWNSGRMRHLDAPREPRQHSGETPGKAYDEWQRDVGRIEGENAGNLITLMWAADVLGRDPIAERASKDLRMHLERRHGIYEIPDGNVERDGLALRASHTGLLPDGKPKDER